MNLPLLALLGSTFPPTIFWSCISLPPPNPSARYKLSLSILSTCFFPRASVHCAYHIILGFFPLCCSSSSSLSLYTAVSLVLIHNCFAHLLFSPVSNTRICLMLDCTQSPEQSLAGFIGAQKIANSTGSVCGITNRWSLSSLESEDIMRMDYSHCLKTCWFLHGKA